MNSEERRDEVSGMLAGADHGIELSKRDRQEYHPPDKERLEDASQRYLDAEACMIQGLSREAHEKYLLAKSKLLWEHYRQMD